MLALMLSGCSFEGRFGERERVIVESAVAAPELMCQARARFFRGTVSVPCVDIARITAP